MGAEDYAWVVETHALGLNFCLTFVRGVGPDEVISRLGGGPPVSIVSAAAALSAAVAVQERIDEDGASLPSGLDYVAVTRAGDWTMIIEPNGFLCTRDEAMRALSATGETVSFYFNENTTPRFTWAVGGEERVWLDPAYPEDRDGSDPGRLDGLLAEVGFVLEPPDDDGESFDDRFRERTVALMERMTGVRWDLDFLESATFRCAGVAGVGSRAPAEPWYAEVRDELAAYAEDPHERADDRWGEHGPGQDGEDRELALAIAHAPAGLVARMTVWTWERPFRLAGILDEPWFAPIRDAVRRGETVSPAADLSWMFAKAEAAGGGSRSEMFADLRRAFPELGGVVIPPPSPPPAERPAVRRKREARERQEEQWRLADLQRTWGGRIPSDRRLLEPAVQSRTLGLVAYDRDLVDRIAEAGPRVQREMAVWAARYCCVRSGLIAYDWVEAGVTALERGSPPPPWFADFDAAFARWRNVPRESIVHFASVSLGNGEAPRIDPAVSAMHAVIMARHGDPLIAAMDTVRGAVALDDPRTGLAAFRAAFELA